MKNVVVLGASGRTGVYILRRLSKIDGICVTAFDIKSETELQMTYPDFKFITGDVNNRELLSECINDGDIVIASLEGEVLPMAQSVSDACRNKNAGHIIWLTGMGIHGEIKGVRKIRLDRFVKMFPDYIKAADTVAECGISYTLLRCPDIHDGENSQYCLTDEGEQPRNKNVERSAIAEFIADAVSGKINVKNRSIAITN